MEEKIPQLTLTPDLGKEPVLEPVKEEDLIEKAEKAASCHVGVNASPNANLRPPTDMAASPKKKMTKPGARISASIRNRPA